jgi:hypothetical protein
MSRLPTAQENTALQAMFPNATTFYMGLNTSDPGTTGTGEVTGGSYGRQGFNFTNASSGSISNVAAINFTGMPAEAGGVGYLSTWSLVTSGSYEGGGTLSGVASVPSGATIALAIAALSATVS